MKFAEIDVLEAPPPEVRMGLQPGDRVGLYRVTASGFRPVEAVVVDSPELGWFVGETERGEQILFNADQVADVLLEAPSMSGMFDLFRRMAPPVPGSQLPALPPEQLPAQVQPTPQERRGLLNQLLSVFRSPLGPPAAPTEPGAPRKSIFDIFRRKEAPQPAGGPLTPGGPEGVVARIQKRESMFSIFEPGKPGPLAPIVERAASIVLPEGPGPLAPIVEKALAPFEIIPESAPPETFEAKQTRQMELFAGMFPGAGEEGVTARQMFSMFRPEEVQPEEEVIPPDVPARMHRAMKVLPMPRRTTLLPTVEDVARGLVGFFNPVEELWEFIQRARDSQSWAQSLEEDGYAKEGLETLGTCGGPPDMYQELAAFLHIPWDEMMKRLVTEEVVYEGQTSDEVVSDEEMWMDIVYPSIEIITEAFELIKPPQFPGRFVVEKSDHGCMFEVSYVEGQEGPSGGRSAEMEDEPEEEEELPPEAPVPPQEPIDIEKQLAELERLSKESERTTQELLKQLEPIMKRTPGTKSPEKSPEKPPKSQKKKKKKR